VTTNAFAGATSFSVTVLTVNEHFLWQAEELYKKALEIDPKHITTIYNYGGLLKNARHDWDGAEAMYKRALELDPRDVGTLCNYGTLLHDVRKRYDEAEAVYKQALEVGSADALAHSLTLTLARSLSLSLSPAYPTPRHSSHPSPYCISRRSTPRTPPRFATTASFSKTCVQSPLAQIRQHHATTPSCGAERAWGGPDRCARTTTARSSCTRRRSRFSSPPVGKRVGGPVPPTLSPMYDYEPPAPSEQISEVSE
jgi:hypothetical protein